MENLTVQPLAEGLIFGEGPRWHDGKLWVSDMHATRVVTCDMQGSIEEVVRVPERPSGLGWLPDGRLLIVSMMDYRLCVVEGGELRTHADLRPYCGGDPNDMVVDAQGRAYVGNFGYDLLAGEDPKPADLLMVDLDGKVTVAATDLQFPNGTVITPDGRTLIVAETFASCLTAFDVDPASGALSNRRVFASLPDRTPDGICLDAEGCVWASCFMSGEYLRVREGGEITHRIDVGDDCGVACMLGGPDGRTLFTLTADTDVERLAKSDSRCRIEICTAPSEAAGLP